MNVPVFLITFIAIILGLIIVFIVERKRTKPIFVKVIWALVSLTMIFELIIKVMKQLESVEYKAIFQLYMI